MSATDPITVLIVDDHPVVRDGLKAMISSQPHMRVVGEAGTGLDGVAAYFSLRPTVVLMDLLLPDINGADAIRRICSKSSDAQIVVLTTLSGDEGIYRALEAGARGYLLKDMVRQELIRAIEEVSAGRRYIPAAVGTLLAETFPRADLTSREVEVLQLVATGLRNKEIAFKLNVSEATVNAHVKHILEKLNVADRTEAVVTALRRGLLRL